MDKRAEAIRRDWIANAQQYDPIMRDILLQPDIQELSIQYLLNISGSSRKPKLNVRHKPRFKPDYKYKPPRSSPAWPAPIPAPRIIEEQSALLGFAKAYAIKSYGVEDELTFLNRVKPAVIRFFNRVNKVKARLILHCEMENINNDTKEVQFRSGPELILRSTYLNGLFDMAKQQIVEEMYNYVSQGSGWRLVKVVKLTIHTNEYSPLRGSSYVELPEFIKAKKAVINIKNTDTQCFKWCVTRALNPVKTHAERVDKQLKVQAQQLR